MHPAIERILWSEQELAVRVQELAAQLCEIYNDSTPLMVGVLTGSFPFIADLVRAMDIAVEVDFVAVSSYGGSTRSSGVVRILKDLDDNIEGRDVVLVEDIIDTGLTLRYLRDNLETRGPRTLRICALLDKAGARTEAIEADFVGFRCPSEFVVGYGLDYAGLYRNLPYIGVLRRRMYTADP